MLTRKQLDLLEFIDTRIQRDGVPPSFDEMKDALALKSKSGIHRLITALEERGFIRRLAHKARALEIVKLPDAMTSRAPARPRSVGFTPHVIEGSRRTDTPPPPSRLDVSRGAATSVPLIGRIAAGVPIEAIDGRNPNITVPASMMASSGNHFALEVKGDSMIEAGINDGDVVVIREQDTADTGDIVVALIDEHEVTLKKFRRKGARIALEPANQAYETRVFDDDKVRVQGRLVGLIRSY